MVDLVPKANMPATSGLVDSLILGTVKAVEERALSPIIGNGTARSGIIKIFGGSLVDSSISGKPGKYLGGAMIIDGVEDIVAGVITPRLYGTENASEDNW
ncbi:MAG: hypothetical protein WC149_08650 [Arcobacteraceae bacterium]